MPSSWNVVCEHTKCTAREAADASPRETSGRGPDGAQRELRREGARGEGADEAGSGGHCEC